MAKATKKLTSRENRGIPDINKIRAQYEAGIPILQLANYWGIPYATLYRELKGEEEKVDEGKKQNG